MRALTRGALAGLIGTAAMTAAQAAEMRMTGRRPSMVPGQVAGKLLRRKPKRGRSLARRSMGMHWAHGVAQGAVRASLGGFGVRGAGAAAAHFSLMWSSDAVLYKALGISPWPWRWSLAELAPDVGHKALYAAVTSAAYDRLTATRGPA